MSDLSRLRAVLKARSEKPGALGTAEANICLDVSLIEDLGRLEQEKADLADAARQARNAGDQRMGGNPAAEPDFTDINARIAAAEQAVGEATITILLRALPSSQYQQILGRFPDADDNKAPAEKVKLQDALIQAGLVEIRLGDEVQDGATWTEICEQVTDGEADPIRSTALALNRRSFDIPKSWRRSDTTR